MLEPGVDAVMIWSTAKANKCVSMDNQPCMVRPMLLHFNCNELNYYLFIISTNRCNGIYNTAADLFSIICFSNKTENLNLKALNIIKNTYESKTLAKHI